ncbi:MAG: hypothetical protein DMG26_19680 [Acidobacteria bacterium]|nr:MAG: hypothetical protein DMG26_19680 [Acidobacteriota bacterium]
MNDHVRSFALSVLGVGLALAALAAAAPQAYQDWRWANEGNRSEFADFEQFLAAHNWIAGKLRENPSLANRQDFLNDNRELKVFLNAHPFVQSALRKDPAGFMRREQGFEQWERQRAAASDNPERSAVAEFDQFLSNHPWIAKQLKEGPARANDKDFSSDNRELAQFLNAHPFVQSALRRDPDGFMRRVRNFENYGMFEDDSAMQSDLADLDQFMANHPWIARKLREKPSLANDGDFLNGDPELRDFLNAHPALREAFREHPRAVMNRERAF